MTSFFRKLRWLMRRPAKEAELRVRMIFSQRLAQCESRKNVAAGAAGSDQDFG